MVQVGIDRLGLDLLHNPFTSVRCSKYRTPLIVTFHDIQHHYFPEFFKAREARGRDQVYRKAADEAKTIIADSFHTKQTLEESYNIPSDKIHVVHLGVGSEYQKIDDKEMLRRERSELGLVKPFLYYPAATWRHKNHDTLLRALAIIKNRGHFDGDLVLTGVATSAKDSLITKIAELGLQDSVRILGYLPYEKLPVIYNLARMMVFPSLFEGFGMPVLEAMACGCPVLCSNTTSLPEVGGNDAVYFDPTSPEAIAESITILWNDDSVLQTMRMAGQTRAGQFTWAKTARLTQNIYMQTVQ
jgi:glycosyltransferase involved in cell wall biosynthesis